MGKLSFWEKQDRSEPLHALEDIHTGKKKKEKGVEISAGGLLVQDSEVLS